MTKQKQTRKEKFSAQPKKNADLLKKDSAMNLNSILGLIIALSAFVLYANTLGHGYAMDDFSLILENKSTIKGFGAISEIFKTSYRFGYIFVTDDLYRPLSKSVMAIEWGISPNNPSIGHWVNVLLFSYTAWLLFQTLLVWLKGNNWIAFVSTMLFVAHPIHTEVVANIKSIDEILGFLFGILLLRSVYNFAVFEKTGYLIKSAIWFILALFSKESAITFIALIPFVILIFSDKPLKKSLVPLGVNLLMALLFFAIRGKVLGHGNVSIMPSVTDNMLAAAPDMLSKFATAVFLLGLYLKMLFVPYPLSFDNSFPQLPIVGIGSWQFIIASIVLLSMLIWAIYGIKKRDLTSFALFFFFITVSVSSNIFVTIGTHYAERLMFTPSFGICLLTGIVLYRYIPGKSPDSKVSFINLNKSALVVFAFIFLIYGGMTIARNPVWKNNETLYASGIISAPNSCRTQYYLGNSMIKENYLAGKSQKEQDSLLNAGIKYLKESIRLYPRFTDAWNQMGIAYARLKNMDESIRCYQEALKGNHMDPVVHNNIGTAYFQTRQYDLALQSFQEAVRLNPRYAEAWNNMGSVYGTNQKFDEAISCFEKSVAADPNYSMAYYYLGITWRSKGNEMMAQQYLDKAYALNPNLK